MKKYIDNINFVELEAMKYYAPPSSWTDEKRKEITQNRIFSGEFWGSEKKDGFFSKLIKDEDGNIFLLSRNKGVDGEYPNKAEWCPHLQEFFNSLPNGTCLLGELYLPSKPGSKNVSTILGCLKEKAVERQNKNEKIHLYIFDILAYNNKVYINDIFVDRINQINIIKNSFKNEFIEFAEYYNGKELWDLLQNVLAVGGEGIVITKESAIYQPGKRPTKDTLKCKKELQDTIDAVIIGALPPTKDYAGGEAATWKYWEDQRTGEKFCDTKIIEPYMTTESYQHYLHGGTLRPISKLYYLDAAASLRVGVYKDGNIVEIGSVSGVEEDILMNWEKYIGKVVELGAMEIDNESHALRHPRILSWREDKNPKECLWEQLV